MPDGVNILTTPPAPPVQLWPGRTRPELVADAFGVFLADAQGNCIGFDTTWGPGGPLQRNVLASRTEGTRNL